ncbi:MAG: hypothetical protein GQ552_00180 [Flavobacteriaceae bacterium]|nr:hypothetical protein [Flavobacteriaceae bacterium]
MKKYTLLFFLTLVLFYSCNTKEKNKIHVEIKTEIDLKEDSTELKQVETTTERKPKPGLFFLTDLIGKYPTQEKIFENKILTNRLKKINRLDFDKLITNWNTETPITIENQIIHSSGCKVHDCPSNGYELFIDLINDNINIYHFSSNILRVYTEKDWITLPKAYADEIDIKKSNAKIGSTSDDMKSTYTIYSKNNPKK